MRLRLPSSALALAVAVAACAPAQAQTGGPAPAPAPQPPAPATPSAPAPASARARDHVDADVQFVHGMIGHHQQALTMTAMAPTHGASERLRLLAQKIDLSQRDEIASMARWLEARGLPASGGHEHHAASMPGMLTPEQLARLDAARGTEFDRLFLTYMIQHHQGALTMVEQLFAAPRGGQEAELFQFASDVDADQRAEIERMQQMLSTLPTRRSPSP
jgi:uncharacterized protein (DUF305 family)